MYEQHRESRFSGTVHAVQLSLGIAKRTTIGNKVVGDEEIREYNDGSSDDDNGGGFSGERDGFRSISSIADVDPQNVYTAQTGSVHGTAHAQRADGSGHDDTGGFSGEGDGFRSISSIADIEPPNAYTAQNGSLYITAPATSSLWSNSNGIQVASTAAASGDGLYAFPENMAATIDDGEGDGSDDTDGAIGEILLSKSQKTVNIVTSMLPLAGGAGGDGIDGAHAIVPSRHSNELYVISAAAAAPAPGLYALDVSAGDSDRDDGGVKIVLSKSLSSVDPNMPPMNDEHGDVSSADNENGSKAQISLV